MDSTFESTSENKSRLQNLRCLVTCKVKHAERCSAQAAGAAALLQPHPTAQSIVIFVGLRSLSLHRVHFVHPTCLET